jgi:hypothetical protein
MAPAAVIVILPVLGVDPVLAVNEQVMVPVLLPLVPDVIASQSPPEETAAVHGMVPYPVLETPNVVVPAVLATSRLDGVTESVIVPACVTLTVFGLPAAPVAVTWMVAVLGVDPE